jgi:hypothetical protein
MPQAKSAITKAFAALRKAGYFAKQNWQCCQSCGFAAVPEGKTQIVFYHAQDRTTLNEQGKCYLSWSGDGKEITKILNENGVETEWDGNDNTRILITDPNFK